jgi:hypothetical protein
MSPEGMGRVSIFHVSNSSVCQWKKKLEEGGEQVFFGMENRNWHIYKLLSSVLSRIQSKLDTGQSVNSIAKEEGLSEGNIRYGIKTGQLKIASSVPLVSTSGRLSTCSEHSVIDAHATIGMILSLFSLHLV